MNYILIAEELEAKNIKIPKKLENNTKIIITGFGEYHALRTIINLFKKGVFKKGDKFFNVGYCGANTFDVGEVVIVGKSYREKPSNFAKDKTYTLDKKSKVKCYTSTDFVEKSDHKGIFDMELYILATIFPKIKSIKVVSDNLNLKQYRKVDFKKPWQKANKMLFAQMD
jgi:hypothetical protein